MLSLSTFLMSFLLVIHLGMLSSEAALYLSSSSSSCLPHSSRRTTRCFHHQSIPSSSLSSSRSDDNEVAVEQAAVDDVCGQGFYKQTGPDGDYCVLDYDTIFATTTTAAAAAAATTQEEGPGNTEIQQDLDYDQQQLHYWDALESQNAARRKFGLSDLTLKQYIALQAENHLTGQENLVQKTAEVFAQFDTNNDGVVCVQELREGLQKILRKTDHLSASRALRVMQHFDDDGDGVLQPNEFMTIGQLRERLDAVIQAEREEMMADMTPIEQQKQQQEQDTVDGGVSLIGRFFNMFVDTCESNFDCNYPQVCCDYGYKKSCCSSGITVKKMQLEYATVPVLQQR